VWFSLFYGGFLGLCRFGSFQEDAFLRVCKELYTALL
jgi:hypothetical protein